MESDLFKQLEDKKKGCGSLFIDENGNDAPCKLLLVDRVEPEPHFCPTCKSNIAILEQAIAEIKKRDKDIDELAESSTFALCALMKENKELKDEMQKQRQEIIEDIKTLGRNNKAYYSMIDGKNHIDICIEDVEQLNQPKTEE